ncbi:MAG: hypothetical protein ACTSRL_03980 [Candidatus Helarchaeota archaeon]
MIREIMQLPETEVIIRLLAEHFGDEYTPFKVLKALKQRGQKVSNLKIKEILSLIHVKFPEIIGYKHVGAYHIFYIRASYPEFLKWFQEWFKKKF